MNPPTDAERVADADSNGCLRCCLAAILEVPLTAVPQFVLDWADDSTEAKEGWIQSLSNFLRGFGMTALLMEVPEDPERGLLIQLCDLVHVRCGQTPIGTPHAVVYRGDEMIYDCNGRDSAEFWPLEFRGYLAVVLVPLDAATWAARRPNYEGLVWADGSDAAEDAAAIQKSLNKLALNPQSLITGDELKARLDSLTGDSDDVVDCAAERLTE